MKFINSQRRLWLRLLGAVGTVAIVASMLMVVDAAAAPTGASASLEQCTNGATGTTIQLQQCAGSSIAAVNTYKNWVNGNANGSKAHWREGEFISYRVRLSGLAAGPHTLVISYQTVNSKKHAIDYLGSFDATETTSATATTFHKNSNDPCADLVAVGQMTSAQCVPSAPTATQPIPPAALANCNGSTGTIPSQTAGEFKMFGPTGSTFGLPVYTSENVTSGSGQCSTTMTIAFSTTTALTANQTMVIAWGGHIASGLDWGLGNSATNISGSPFHMSLSLLDGASTGSQDRALATSAIFFNPTITTSLTAVGGSSGTDISVNIGGQVYDTATLHNGSDTASGKVTYTVYTNDTCTTFANVGSGAQLGNAGLNLAVTNGVPANSTTLTFNKAGTYYWQASYSGDSVNQPATSSCATEKLTVGKSSPSVLTQVKKNADNSDVTNGAHVAIGTVAYDTASLSGGTSDASGNVTFYVEKGDDQCTLTGATSLGTKALGTKSDTTTLDKAGTYYFWAVYAGDDNNAGNTSSCSSETVVVDRNAPSVLTQVKKNADNSDVTNGAHVAIGTVAYDTASLSGGTSDASGNVTFYVEKGDDQCTLTGATSLGTKALGTKSDTTTLDKAGTYYFWAVYAGDDNNAGNTSSCSSETVVVDRNAPSVLTQVKKNADNSDVTNGAHVAIGTVAYDTASLSGGTSDASGNVTFYVEKGDDQCTLTGATSLGTKALGTKSDTTTLDKAGTYYFWAVYAGDDNNAGNTSSCSSETVVVDRNAPSVLTQVKKNADNSDVTNGAHVAIGTVAYDTASLSGGTSDASGNVTFYVEKGDDQCTLTGATSLGTKALGTKSDTTTLDKAGTYYFWAVYAGDDNNAGNTSSCSSETVVVDRNAPSVLTQVKKNADNSDVTNGAHVAIGTVAYDTASLSGGTSDASGNVTFYVEKGDDQCTLTGATSLGTKALGTKSDTTTLDKAGTYYFWAVYAGDDNNAGNTSSCSSETVVVDKNAPGASTAQTLRPNDAATLTGATSGAGGSFTFSLFDPTDGTCAGTPAFTQTVSVNGDGIYNTTNSAFLASTPGTWRWVVEYSGDANNTGFTIVCGTEQFTIDNNVLNPQQI